MSPLTVTLTIGNGPLVGQAYEFRDTALYVVGRAADCYPQLLNEHPYKDISRHHCLLSIQLPEVRLLDLSSTHGTFVNGAKVGQPASLDTPRLGDPLLATIDYFEPTGWHPLEDGDVIALGNSTVLFVRVQVREEGKLLADQKQRRRRGDGAGHGEKITGHIGEIGGASV
jgi:pSer/pThr/pTyr-binding forkhead associated (FHA) protein